MRLPSRRRKPLALRFSAASSPFFLAALLPAAAAAAAPPCKPCGGVTTPDLAATAAALQAAPRVAKEARLYVRWRQDALAAWDPAPGRAIADAGGTPWLAVVFHAPSPLVEHAADLERELAGLAGVASNAGPV